MPSAKCQYSNLRSAFLDFYHAGGAGDYGGRLASCLDGVGDNFRYKLTFIDKYLHSGIQLGLFKQTRHIESMLV